MTQSSWVNPNGLPADEQITSARDMAILARAILRELPEYEMYWHIPAIKFGRRVMRNTNGADRPLSRRRRHEDRLHLRLRLQRGGDRDAQRPQADRGGVRLALRHGALREGRAAVREGLHQRRPLLADALARHRRCAAADRRRAAQPARRDVRQAPQAPRRRGGRRRRDTAGASSDADPELGLCGDAAEPARRAPRRGPILGPLR